jgi:hypothetical protein
MWDFTSTRRVSFALTQTVDFAQKAVIQWRADHCAAFRRAKPDAKRFVQPGRDIASAFAVVT